MTHHKQIAPSLAEGAVGNNDGQITGCQPTTSQTTKQISGKRARNLARHIAAMGLIGRLEELYPNTFAIYQKKRKPLKLNIGDDLKLALGADNLKDTITALGIYQQNHFYLRACVEGAVRIDLAGLPAGVVTSEEAAQAAAQLAAKRVKWKAKREARKAEQKAQTPRVEPPRVEPPRVEQKPPDPPKPKRLTLADLRAAARARREGKLP